MVRRGYDLDVPMSPRSYFSDNRIEAGHGRRSLRGGVLVVGTRLVTAAIQVGSILVLARLLTPEDYGLVSMVTAITNFAPLFVSLGTQDAVVQRVRITEQEVSALFWLNVLLGIGLSVAFVVCSPLIARFYGDPRLTMIASVAGLTFVASALSCQHYTLLRRAMEFRELAVIEVVANIVSVSAAIARAYAGFGYWALVMRPLMMSSLLAVGVWLRCRWVPPRPAITGGVSDMLKLGLGITGFTVADQISRSADRIALGRRSGSVQLGYYHNASFIYETLIEMLSTPLHIIAVTSLSKARDDLTELRRLWRKALATFEFYAMPGFGLLSVTSQDLIVVLLGPKWSYAGVLLAILALRGIPHTAERTLGWLHVTAGRGGRWSRWGLVAAAAHVTALLLGLPFGPVGVVTAYVICMFILFVPALVYAGAPLGITARDVVDVVWRPATGALVAAAAGHALRFGMPMDGPPVLRIALLALAYVGVYAVVAVGLLRERAPVRVMLDLMRSYVAGRDRGAVRTPGGPASPGASDR